MAVPSPRGRGFFLRNIIVASSVYADRIAALRAAMAAQRVDACIVPSSDPHSSEYLPEHWQARSWLSGFDGSAGTLVVTAQFAGLWTDSRYWEQAEHDLAGTGIKTMRAGAEGVPSFIDWLAGQLPSGSKVAADGQVISVRAHRQWQAELGGRGIALAMDRDLVGSIWADRAGLPQQPVYEHLPPYACRTRAENLRAVRAAMGAHGADWHWISSLDDIAWLFNLRGSDVSYNPVFVAHALVGRDTACLFVGSSRGDSGQGGKDKIDANLRAVLRRDGVDVQPYDAAGAALAGLAQGQALLVDPARTTIGVLAAAAYADRVEAINPSQLLKSRKTDAELAHVRESMEQDGAALCEFFAWFEAARASGETITELTVDERICAARARQPDFVCPSFGTIAAYNANGAMPHYHATEASHAEIRGDGLLLIDSGGQYKGGTTDITRVVAVGSPSLEQRRDYTVVLKGMIALSRAVFPRGTPAPMIDAIARLPIWQAGVEYGHGTGHGVGYFLNVHEGPQAISYRTPVNPHMGMEPGMITSNEPGLYRPGRWGIRIENLVANRPAAQTEFGEFLGFETLTLCPMDRRCIECDLLEAGEVAWLDAYHAEVRERLLPRVQGAARQWLEDSTGPL
ncbi:aminopeptidase P family protein [Candidimonas humi]|uniref:M24 family metallopeptidase n=1 Tax=Candidimonas humi TaxID=683355 RepID=A0ABV8NTL0_9BURK|nr:aminopeptidase P family protein [Candidimonas humi]MBV6305279.1 aminopeptidase P family protein [Candidimonas humi]